jgi:hypothetical protein
VANSEGVFGGNGSVNWKVTVYNGKDDKIKSEKTNPNDPNDHGWSQEGHDGNEAGGKFQISLQLPKDEADREELENGLRDAADAVRDHKNDINFKLRIEPGEKKQITLNWPSAPEAAPSTITGG